MNACFFADGFLAGFFVELRFFVQRLEMGQEVLRDHSESNKCGHAAVDLDFAEPLGLLDLAERFGAI